VPVLVDQPFWAARLHRLGIAPHPLPLHELTTDALATRCAHTSTNQPIATGPPNSLAASAPTTAPQPCSR
jgi:hypothetical protein